MRKISNFKDDRMREEQLNVLVDIVDGIKGKQDLHEFLTTFLTESELAYIGQRLNIMRMLLKNFSYQEIEEKLNVPPNTICRVNAKLDSGGKELSKIISQYRYKTNETKSTPPRSDSGNGFVSASMPGAIGNKGKYKK